MQNKTRMPDFRKILTPEIILRIGIFGTFLGHGIFALSVKKNWIPYFASVGISQSGATFLMPFIGGMDVLVAFFVLFRPYKFILVWASLWAFVTALIRPLSGEPIWDFIERWANWAAPLALLSLRGFPKKLRELFS